MRLLEGLRQDALEGHPVHSFQQSEESSILSPHSEVADYWTKGVEEEREYSDKNPKEK